MSKTGKLVNVQGIRRLALVSTHLMGEGHALAARRSAREISLYRLVNVRGGRPINLLNFGGEIEKAAEVVAQKISGPFGDVPSIRASSMLRKVVWNNSTRHLRGESEIIPLIRRNEVSSVACSTPPIVRTIFGSSLRGAALIIINPVGWAQQAAFCANSPVGLSCRRLCWQSHYRNFARGLE